MAGEILMFPALCIPDDWRKRFAAPSQIPDSVVLWGMELGRGFIESVYGMDVFSEIGGYQGPVLILHGDSDEIVPLSYSVRARDLFGDAELIVLKGEGHGFSARGNEETVRRLYDFVLRAARGRKHPTDKGPSG